MNLLFVRPCPSSETIGLQHLMVVEPLELELLSAVKRKQDIANIADLILEKRTIEYFLDKYKPDVVCITGYITNVSTIIDYCKISKKNNTSIITIVGGVHCEVCPEDFDDDSIDYRVVRNAIRVFPQLLNYIDGLCDMPAGVMKKGDILESINLPNFDFSIPYPDRELTAKHRSRYFYIFQNKVALIKTSFGCPFTCSFCFCRVITGGQYVQRPMEEIMIELEMIKEKEVYIVDDDFLIDKNRLNTFIIELKRRNIKKRFLVYGRADFIAANPELMHDLAEVGLKTVIVGFESFSDDELSTYNKKTSVEMYRQTMFVLKREKIECFATIIIPPHWDKSDFKNMIKVVKYLGLCFVNLQPLTPLPKTDISFPEEKIILNRKEYEKWDLAHVSVMPEKLSVSEFYSQILKAYNSILYSPPVLWKYLTTYKPIMLYKMLVGGYRVGKQYKKKINDSQS